MSWQELVIPQKGRCLVATRSLPPGSEVLRCRGEAWAVHAPERAALCSYCLARPEKPPGRCTSCKVLRYCSRRCQTTDWSSHRDECKSLARLAPTTPGPTLLLAARLLRSILVEASSSHEGSMQGGKLYSSLERLQHHEDALTSDRRSLLRDMASLVREIVQGDRQIHKDLFDALDPDYVVRLICRLGCNAITITDAECRPLGIGLFLGAVAANHSCRPNCFALFDGPVLHLRTIQAVDKGSELCIAYIDVTAPRACRQKELKDGYHFECQCARCQSVEELEKEEVLHAWLCPRCGGPCMEMRGDKEKALYRKWKAGSPPLSAQDGQEAEEIATVTYVCRECGEERKDVEETMTKLARAEMDERDGFEMYNEGKLEGGIRYYKKAYAVYETHLHPLHTQRHGLTSKLANLCIGLQDWSAGREYSRLTLRHLEYIMPPGTPIPALEHLLLGKLEWWMDDAESASSHLRAAIKVLRVTHGDEHVLVRTAIALAQEVESSRRGRRR